MAGRVYTQADNRESFSWYVSDDRMTIFIGRPFAGAWIPAAEVSVEEARVTMVTPYYRNSPLLFDIVGRLCAACERRLMAA